MAIITSLTQLQQSTSSRAATPNGNIYFNPNGTLELITVEELATIDFGAGPVANPLTNDDGITTEMLYKFERQERELDENLRELEVFLKGTYIFAGAYDFINGRKLSSASSSLGDDRRKIRGSGFIEYADDGTLVDRIYFGVRSLNDILGTSQPYYQLVSNSDTEDFYFTGDINEVIQVFGSTANGDSTAGDFDNRLFLALSLRTWGQTHSRVSLVDSGIPRMSGFSGAFGIGESPNPYHDDFDLADVYGGSAIAPWNTMSFETLSSPDTVTGLVNTNTSSSENGSFSARINASGATLKQIVAFMDALAIQDADIDSGTNTRNGRENPTLYTLDPTDTSVVLRQGIYITDVPVADRASVKYTDNDGTPLKYETVSGGIIQVGQAAANDPKAYIQMFYVDTPNGNAYNTLTAVTVNDASGTPIKELVAGRTVINWDFAFSTNTQDGYEGNTQRDVVAICEGNGVATFAKATHTITDSTTQVINCSPSPETN